MLFRTPTVSSTLTRRLDRLDAIQAQLSSTLGAGGRWTGSIRRLAMTRAVESSTSIEGFRLEPGRAEAIVDGETEPTGEAEQAIACYRRAMDHVAVMAADSSFQWLERVVLDLHFDACYFQPDVWPGRWRAGPMSITGPDGRIIYRAPPAQDVHQLMAETVAWLEAGDTGAHPAVRAAMAHLHMVSVHPFRDGNGRVARIIQSLVLAREQALAPELGSIEEYLGSHTPEYYQLLQRVQGASYDPTRSAASWVEFCVQAHLEQAEQRARMTDTAKRRWTACEGIVAGHGWPDRLVIALERALTGYADRRGYAGEAAIPVPTAATDLRRLVDAGLLAREGHGRATRYRPTSELRRRIDGDT